MEDKTKPHVGAYSDETLIRYLAEAHPGEPVAFYELSDHFQTVDVDELRGHLARLVEEKTLMTCLVEEEGISVDLYWMPNPSRKEEPRTRNQSPVDCTTQASGDADEELATLRQQAKALLEEKNSLQAKEAERIELLHSYNDVKDVCQIIMGRLAEMKRVTARAVHADYGLDGDD